MAIINNGITFKVTNTTAFLTLVKGGEAGKPKSAFVQGSAVNVTGYIKGSVSTAKAIELLQN
jgi:hypothetical protein